MDQITLATIAGSLLSLVFSYVPGFSTWYDGKDAQTKALIMGAALLLVTAGAFGLSCAGWGSYFECTETGVQAALTVFFAALVANQATYGLTKHIGGADIEPA